MTWKEIVKIQYNAMLKASAFYILILSVAAALLQWLSINSDFKINPFFKIFLALAFLCVLLQNFGVLYLINVQRQGCYLKEQGGNNLTGLNKKENRIRKIALILSGLATFFIWFTIVLVLLPIL